MGLLGKLAFWKKNDDFDFNKEFGADLGLGKDPGMPGFDNNSGLNFQNNQGFDNLQSSPQLEPSYSQPPGRPAPMRQPFAAPMAPSQPVERDYSNDKFEVVSAKLDSIRYTLESINQRIANLERAAYGETEKRRSW